MLATCTIFSIESQEPPTAHVHPWQAHAQLIAAARQRGVASMIETGQRLIDAKGDLDHGAWEAMLQLSKLPFGQRTAQMLMRIAEHPTLSNANHGSLLPPCWRTLHELTKIEDSVLLAALADGGVHPGMERKDAHALLGKPAASKPKPSERPSESKPSLAVAWAAASEIERRRLLDQIGRAGLCEIMSSELKAEFADAIVL